MSDSNSLYLTMIAVCLIVFATLFGGCHECQQTEREYIKAGFVPQPTMMPAWGKPTTNKQ